MKILTLIIFLFSLNAFAQEKYNRNFGVGFLMTNPSGVSLNFKKSDAQSIDALIAYDLKDENEFYLHSTYLFHHPDSLISLSNMGIGWYSGLGARIKVEENAEDAFLLGIRASIGVSAEFKRAPIELFAELAPTFDIISKTDVDLQAGLGARFYF